MSDYPKSTPSRPPNRKSTLLTARRMYSLVFDGLARADRALSNMAHLLHGTMSEKEVYPYLAEIVRQRDGIHQALNSAVFMTERVFPKAVRDQFRRKQDAKRKR